jgi:membrane protein YqaA with SNARE-associated domain
MVNRMPRESLSPRWLVAWLGRTGTGAALVWGFAEGTLFFVVPDVGFTLTTAFRPSRGLAQLALAVAGALVAGSVMYAWARSNPREARAAVAAVPFVGESMIEATDRRLDSRGVRAMFDSPLGGVPYKVYAVLAPERLSYAEFLLLSVLARAERMLVTWIPTALIARWFRRMEEGRKRRILLIAHAAIWIVVYALYWGKLWPA